MWDLRGTVVKSISMIVLLTLVRTEVDVKTELTPTSVPVSTTTQELTAKLGVMVVILAVMEVSVERMKEIVTTTKTVNLA